MLTKEEVVPQCPVATTVSLIGNKWKLLIIRNLLNGKARFGDLKDGIEGISKKVLTDNLKSMVDDGIIIRTAYNEIPPRVEYELSDLGNSLRPIIDSMKIWGEEYKKMKS
jgi:DNA-binding HxlR family transcriptional regulator